MRIDPVLRALRSDAAPQHTAQRTIRQALARWRSDPVCSGLFDELDAYGDGAPFEDCVHLAGLFGEAERGREFADSLVRRFAPVLGAEPLARMPFRQSSQGSVANLLLGRAGRAVLSLAAREPGTSEPPVASFADGERHDLMLAGEGEGAILTRRPGHDDSRADIGRRPVMLAPGVRFRFDMASETLAVSSVRRCLVTLRLTRLAEQARPTREYRLSDGAMLGQAAGDPRASRHEMMLAVLGRMGRTDAAPVMAGLARGDGSPAGEHLRWQALRECLALDAAEGFRALCAVARDPADPLASPAGALRAQLLEAHPQLAALDAKEQPCRA